MPITLRTLAITALLFMIFSGCSSRHPGEKKTGLLSGLIDITGNEDKGIKEIISFYGGLCEYGIQKDVYIGQKNETTFWIKFSKSKSIDEFEKIGELPGSNIAYLFYKNLDKEKNAYQHIRSELVFGDGQTMKLEYTPAQLEKVKSKIKVVDKVVEQIKNKNFEGIRNYLAIDTTLFNYNIDTLLTNLRKAEADFGNASEFIPYGFKFFKRDDGREILHISGLIVRDKQHNNFSVKLDPNTREEKVYLLNYKL